MSSCSTATMRTVCSISSLANDMAYVPLGPTRIETALCPTAVYATVDEAAALTREGDLAMLNREEPAGTERRGRNGRGEGAVHAETQRGCDDGSAARMGEERDVGAHA